MKKNVRNRLCSLVLALALTVLLLPGLAPEAEAAEIESGTFSGGLTWTLADDGTLTISGTGAITAEPEVTQTTSVSKIVIGSGITGIDQNALKGFPFLGQIVIKGNPQIDALAFSNMVNLTSFEYGGTVKGIGLGLFQNDWSLSSLTLREGVGRSSAAFSGCTAIDAGGIRLVNAAGTDVTSRYSVSFSATSDTDKYIAIKADLSEGSVEAIADQQYTGSAVQPAVTVKWYGQTVDSSNYSVSYSNNTEPGTATVTVTGKESNWYFGSLSGTFTIQEPENMDVSAGDVTAVYDGQPHTVSVSGAPEGATVTYSTSPDGPFAQEHPVIVNVADSKTVYYRVEAPGYRPAVGSAAVTVTPVSISAASVEEIPPQKYTGSAVIPNAVLTYNGKTLAADVDYALAGSSVNAGTGSVTILGKGNFMGEAAAEFEIQPADLRDAVATVSPGNAGYTGLAHEAPAFTVSFRDMPLEENVHYTFSGWNGDLTDAGTYTATVTGKEGSNFTGSLKLSYTINPIAPTADLFQVNLLTNAEYNGLPQWGEISVRPEVKGLGQYTVEFEKDGVLTSAPPVNAGTYQVSVKLASGQNYTATETGIYLGDVTINKALPSLVIPEGQRVVYDGQPVTVGTSDADILYSYSGDGAVTLGWHGEELGAYPPGYVPTDAGIYHVGIIIAETDNYLPSHEVVKVTIAKRPITVAPEDTGKVYGQPDPHSLYWNIAEGTVAGSDNLNISVSREAGENAGSYKIIASQPEGANHNYDITFAEGIFAIAQAPLTVAANNNVVTYGDEPTHNGVSVAGLINGESMSDLDGVLKFTYSYKQYDDIGEYTITPAGLTSPNYAITYEAGALIVLPKPITVTVDNKSGAYGEPIAELTADDDGGIVGSDTGVYSLATDATAVSPVGKYPITGTALDTNYTITFVDGEYEILKAVAKPATAPAVITGIVYNGKAHALITAGSTDDGQLRYSLDGDNWQDSVPTARAAGTYSVWYKILGDSNHTDSQSVKLEAQIAQVKTLIGRVTAATVKDTLELSAVVLERENTDIPGTLRVDAGQTLKLGENRINYTFLPTDSVNYQTVTGKVTVTVVDTVAPTGKVSVSSSTWDEFLNTITFGQYFKDTQTVTVEASDNLSGVDKIEYFETESVLDLKAVKALSEKNWTKMTKNSIRVTAVDAKQFIYYIRITDRAGNVAYIATSGAEFDTTAPVISGVRNGVTYYTTQTVTVTDKNLASVTLNGKSASSPVTLTGDKDATYTLVATDKAGNKTEVKVIMKTIDSLAAPMKDLTKGNVTSADKAKVQAVLESVQEVLKATGIPTAEKKELEDIQSKAQSLLKIIDDAAKAISTEQIRKVKDKTADNVKLADKADLKKAKEELEKTQAADKKGNYTSAEQAAVRKEIDRLKDAIEAIEETEAVIAAIQALPKSVEPDLSSKTEKAILDACKAYKDLSAHQISLMDKKDIKKLEDLYDSLDDYEIVKMINGKWERGSSKNMILTANGPARKFKELRIDGKVVSSSNYSYKDGSTVITLKASYLQKLTLGKHKVQIVYTDGATDGKDVIQICSSAGNPGTGDGDSNILLFAALTMVMSMTGMGFMLMSASRKRR